MITILTKKQALQAMLDGKEVMGFLACDITTQGEPDPLPGDTGIKTGVYKSHSVNDAFDTYAFFIADIEPEENEPGKKDKSKKTRKNAVDVGKITALHKAKWTNDEIADEMGITVQTVLKYVRQYHERNDNMEQLAESAEKGDANQ